jgi:hypothetical protein
MGIFALIPFIPALGPVICVGLFVIFLVVALITIGLHIVLRYPAGPDNNIYHFLCP